MGGPVAATRARIALFGGSFDPPHRGHFAIASAAADRFALDEVLFAPAGRQPLKQEGAVAPFLDRLAMVTLGCSADRRFTPSTLDAPREDGEPNYTIATLEAAALAYPEAELFCLAGADSFHTLRHWREPQLLLAAAQWIVVSRPGYDLTDPEGMTLASEQRARIHRLDTVHEEAAATDLRSRLASGDPCADLLPAGVAGYIRAAGLYRSQTAV